MGFWSAVETCLRKYITFSGRATRAEYWLFILFCTLLGWMAIIIDTVMDAHPISVWVVYIATYLPVLAVGSRRLQDADFPGYLVFTPFLALPIVGLAIATNQILILYLAKAVWNAFSCTILVITLLPSEPRLTA